MNTESHQVESQDEDEILTDTELCKYLKIGRTTRHILEKSGKLKIPYFRLGRCRRYRKSIVIAAAAELERIEGGIHV